MPEEVRCRDDHFPFAVPSLKANNQRDIPCLEAGREATDDSSFGDMGAQELSETDLFFVLCLLLE